MNINGHDALFICTLGVILALALPAVLLAVQVPLILAMLRMWTRP